MHLISQSLFILPFSSLSGVELLKLGKKHDWVKLNADQLGFYRVNYPKRLWATLARGTARRELDSVDVAGLVEDSFALAEAGELSIKTHLELLR